MRGLEIQSMLVLSTGHVSESTAQALNDRPGDLMQALPWAPQLAWDYGWMWYVDDDTLNCTDFPPEFSEIFKLARLHCCHWVRLDESGPMLESLPFHDW